MFELISAKLRHVLHRSGASGVKESDVGGGSAVAFANERRAGRYRKSSTVRYQDQRRRGDREIWEHEIWKVQEESVCGTKDSWKRIR